MKIVMVNIKTLSVLAVALLSFIIPCNTQDILRFDLQVASAFSPDIKTFYGRMKGKPAWFFQGHLTRCGKIAVETLHNADQEGLNPNDYADAIQAAIYPKDWIEAEILLTRRFLEFISHVREGRMDPMKISQDIKFHSPKTHPADALAQVLENPADCNKLADMAPALAQYAHLKKLLSDYRERFKNKEWPYLVSAHPLKLGDKNPDIINLRKILALHGELEGEEQAGDSAAFTFDEDLEAALRRFQKRFMLEADGVVGGKTKDALNMTGEEIIRKIIINMERLRWLPDGLGDRHIIVNVAGYEVQAFDQSGLKLTIPAIVGRPSRRTPLFYASLKNIVINPSWGVPYSILVHDKIPKIIRDPDYVRRSGFTVTDETGNIVDPDQADWENEGKSYRLRQGPGRNNALGRIKFNIINPYVIYLHGTPDAKLFDKAARAFSSGCIRLKFPDDLAVWVLNDEEKWSKTTIEEAIEKGATQTVSPKEDIPVYFIYQTIWIGEDGQVHVSDDPYGLDKKMAKILTAASKL